MAPTLQGSEVAGEPGDTVIVCKTSYLLSAPNRWDVVALRREEGGVAEKVSVDMVKRVVGLPNEHIEIRDGVVLVNGERLEAPGDLRDIRYLRRGSFDNRSVHMGPREYFVLGDNSYSSRDSREWGPLARGHIFGKVVAIVHPWERARWISSVEAFETD